MPRLPIASSILLATVLYAGDGLGQDGAVPPTAQGNGPTAAVERLFGATAPEASWFTDAFAAAVPPQQVSAIIDGLVADFGALLAVRIDDGVGTVQLERAAIPVRVNLDGSGRIAGLLFGPPVPTAADPAAIADQIEAAATGTAAVLAILDEETVVDRHADRPMAVASAFKLFVLAAYEAAVAEGRRARDDVVEVLESDRSLPSGVLQTLAAGTPVTLELLAGLMIQQSDNTATDILMRVLGRDAVDRMMPRGGPTPTTAELFKLKAAGQAARREAFAIGDPAARQAILDRLKDDPLPAAHQLDAAATWREVEWFATPRELCRVLMDLRAAPALNGVPNPLVTRDAWPWVGFKGGSEFGVLALSVAGVSPEGRRACAVVVANGDAAQADDRLSLLMSAFFRSLAPDEAPVSEDEE
ncbi:MAG: serine hydrolase [Pseudomonadota bacterium]